MKCLEIYKNYRKNLLKIKDDKYTYNVLFLYLYCRLYKHLLEICFKYIGGKKYNIERNKFIYVPDKEVKKALNVINNIVSSLKYTHEESSSIVYEIKDHINDYDIILINTSNIYSIKTHNLKKIYRHHIDFIIKNVLDSKTISEESNFKYLNIIEYFSNNVIFKEYFSNMYMKINFIDQINRKYKNAETYHILSKIKNLYIKCVSHLKSNEFKQHIDITEKYLININFLIKEISV